jgi:hypothetical protein
VVGAAIGGAPYEGDSLEGQTGGSVWKNRTLFVPGSQYVLFIGPATAHFPPQKNGLAPFDP